MHHSAASWSLKITNGIEKVRDKDQQGAEPVYEQQRILVANTCHVDKGINACADNDSQYINQLHRIWRTIILKRQSNFLLRAEG